MTTTIDVKLPMLHSGQRVVADSPSRFAVLACGRRWGKTRLGSALCMYTALRGGRAWWTAPTYPVATVGWRLILALARQIPGVNILRAERLITLPTGGEIRVRSADNPDSLRGEGLDFVVLDEVAFMKEDAWTHALRPALSDRRGGAMFISTPKGRNWFWRLWARGEDPDQPDWSAYHFPTSDNPFIPAGEIEAARHGLPERIFRQEYLAEFIDDAGGVFRGVAAAATAQPQDKAIPGHKYIMGVDWAKHNDFTVITVIDLGSTSPGEAAGARSLVHMDRFNQIDYVVQVERLNVLAGKFKPVAIWVESNSIGEPLIERLSRDG